MKKTRQTTGKQRIGQQNKAMPLSKALITTTTDKEREQIRAVLKAVRDKKQKEVYV